MGGVGGGVVLGGGGGGGGGGHVAGARRAPDVAGASVDGDDVGGDAAA